jgi:alkylation response protein AidB-like acyl-CoA dehydrogenase
MFEVEADPALRAFGDELRAWIEENRVEGLERYRPDPDASLHPNRMTGGEVMKEWSRRLLEGGWICAAWPKEYGGRGLSALEIAVLAKTFHDAGVPRVTRGLAEALVGPALIAHATEEQKRYFLPRIVSGVDSYCQGFSEPDAGSDLASLRTLGVVDGDDIVITGQKVWTSDSEAANMVFVLCRTDPDAPKHRGISYVLVPLADNNIEVRPLRQLNGGADFAEVYFTGARAPMFNLIGGLNNGWNVAMTVLVNERGGGAAIGHTGPLGQFWEVVDLVRKRGLENDVRVRQHLAWAFTKVEIMRFNGLRTLASLSQGSEPGPEGSMGKLAMTEFNRTFLELVLEILGADATIRDSDEVIRWVETFYMSRAMTIAGGASEIQRNIIGERLLGLPRDKQPA